MKKNGRISLYKACASSPYAPLPAPSAMSLPSPFSGLAIKLEVEKRALTEQLLYQECEDGIAYAIGAMTEMEASGEMSFSEETEQVLAKIREEWEKERDRLIEELEKTEKLQQSLGLVTPVIAPASLRSAMSYVCVPPTEESFELTSGAKDYFMHLPLPFERLGNYAPSCEQYQENIALEFERGIENTRVVIQGLVDDGKIDEEDAKNLMQFSLRRWEEMRRDLIESCSAGRCK